MKIEIKIADISDNFNLLYRYMINKTFTKITEDLIDIIFIPKITINMFTSPNPNRLKIGKCHA